MKLRRILARVHRYSGLALLLFVLIAAATGSVLVFAYEIDRWLNPELLRVTAPPDAKAQPLATQIAAAQRRQEAWADGPWQPISLMPGRTGQDASGILFQRPDPQRPGKSMFRQILVDPYSARVLGERERTRARFDHAGAVRWLNDLHGRLLLDDTGRQIMGVAAILWTLSSLAGLVLWWPGRRKLRLALTIKWQAGTARRNYDLHRAVGFYSLPVLFLVALSGIYLAWPSEIRRAAENLTEIRGAPLPRGSAKPSPNAAPGITVDAAVAIARQAFPAGELRRIALPRRAGDVYSIALLLPGEVQRPLTARSTVWIDPSDGQILKIYDATRAGIGDTLLDWQTPLHAGTAFGLPGRIAVALAGIAGVLLSITGFLVWQRRHHASRQARRQRNPQATSKADTCPLLAPQKG